MAEWVAVCRLDEIAEGAGRSLDAAGVAAGGLPDRRRAWWPFPGRCPHSGGSLGHGWIEEGEVVCPLHHWRFKLADGRCTTIRGEGGAPVPLRGQGGGGLGGGLSSG